MNVERYFLRYSFACAHVLLEQKRITDKEYNELENCVNKDHPMSRERLEHLFPAAFRRIKQVAKDMGKDCWNRDVMKRYFRIEHNKYIDMGDGMYGRMGDIFKDMCKVHEATIKEKIEKKGKEFYKVTYDHKERIVLANLLPDTKIGDKITIHHFYAVEKLD